MKLEKPSQLLAAAGWVMVFCIGFLLVTRKVPADGISWGIFALFFLVALMASAVSSPKK